MNEREQMNRQILRLLEAYNNGTPDQRFIQLLVSTGVLVPINNAEGAVVGYKDLFYEESKDTLNRMAMSAPLSVGESIESKRS